eukprot:878452-Rhodomonas_salina.2
MVVHCVVLAARALVLTSRVPAVPELEDTLHRMLGGRFAACNPSGDQVGTACYVPTRKSVCIPALKHTHSKTRTQHAAVQQQRQTTVFVFASTKRLSASRFQRSPLSPSAFTPISTPHSSPSTRASQVVSDLLNALAVLCSSVRGFSSLAESGTAPAIITVLPGAACRDAYA